MRDSWRLWQGALDPQECDKIIDTYKNNNLQK